MYFNKFVFEQAALKTDYGKTLYTSLTARGFKTEVKNYRPDVSTSNDDKCQAFREGKRTLIIGARTSTRFESCRPSADYQLPVLTGCPGLCEYCYLMTRMGEHAYVKLNANIVNIFTNITKYIDQSMSHVTSFELSASSDPIPFEEPTGIVSMMIDYFATLSNGRLRICTKYEPDAQILNANHRGNTDFRFSVNTPRIIDTFEHATPSLDRRIGATKKVIDAGYKTGIMIAPVFLDGNWRDDYSEVLDIIGEKLGSSVATFEVVTHRYTKKAKETISTIFPHSELEMDDQNRKFKMGQFGYGKYIYDSTKMNEAKDFFRSEIARRFPNADLLYIV